MSRSRVRALRRATPLLFVLGAVVMIAFEHWYTLLVGLGLMLAFVVCGTFVIADPGRFLDRDREQDAEADPADGSGSA